MSSPLATALLDALDDDALDRLAERLAPRLAGAAQAAGTAGEVMDAKRAAAYLGLTRDALWKRTRSGELPSSQDGPGCKLFYRRCDLDGWLLDRRRERREP